MDESFEIERALVVADRLAVEIEREMKKRFGLSGWRMLM
jgi:hypothetical protein